MTLHRDMRTTLSSSVLSAGVRWRARPQKVKYGDGPFFWSPGLARGSLSATWRQRLRCGSHRSCTQCTSDVRVQDLTSGSEALANHAENPAFVSLSQVYKQANQFVVCPIDHSCDCLLLTINMCVEHCSGCV